MFDFTPQAVLAVTPLSLVFIVVIVFFAYLVRGIAGFGSALIAVPLLTLMMPLTIVVPLVVFLDYLGSSSQGIKNKEHIVWRDIWPLLPFSVVGVASSLYIMETIDQHILSLCLGAFILLFAVYQLLPLKFGRASIVLACPAGLLGGFVGTLFGTGGPFYVIYLNLRQHNKLAFRASMAALFLIDGAMRLLGYAIKGFYNLETFYYIICAVPVAGLGLYYGGKIHTTIGRETFIRLISVLLLGSGTALLMKA